MLFVLYFPFDLCRCVCVRERARDVLGIALRMNLFRWNIVSVFASYLFFRSTFLFPLCPSLSFHFSLSLLFSTRVSATPFAFSWIVVPRKTGKFRSKNLLERKTCTDTCAYRSQTNCGACDCACLPNKRVWKTNEIQREREQREGENAKLDIVKWDSDASTIHDARFSIHLRNWKRIHSNKSISCCAATPALLSSSPAHLHSQRQIYIRSCIDRVLFVLPLLSLPIFSDVMFVCRCSPNGCASFWEKRLPCVHTST